MANLKAKDADSNNKFIKAIGEGTDTDPFVIEHSDSAVLQQIQSIFAYIQAIHNYLQINPNIYQKVLNSSDLVETKYYLDSSTSDRRIDKIEYSSQLNNYKITETYFYEGSIGDYYLVSIVRSSIDLEILS